MSWRDVAYKDLNDASRSRTLWLLFGLMTISFAGYAAVHGRIGEENFTAFAGTLAVDIVVPLLPLLGIFLGYRSIADDRADGSALLTLSLPHSRRDLLAGTLAGRTTVLLVPSLTTLVAAGIIGAVLYGTGGAVGFLWLLFATALYGLAFVAVGVALSAATTSERWITYGASGGYLVLVFLWSGLVSFLISFVHRFDGSVSSPDWVELLQLAQPSEAYLRLLRAGLDVDVASQYVGPDSPVYIDWWTGLLLLALWVVVPLAVAYRRFSRGDL
jgi:ABC-type transport system involved in multi-copper enzyme maturation permease subunit